MNILVLNGSPKGEKSDTMHITKAFLEGVNNVSSNKIEIIDIFNKKINYCQGDLICMRNGGKCIIKDDMEEILEKVVKCDLLIFSFPLYGYDVPASIKAFLDRTLPLGSFTMEKNKNQYVHVGHVNLQKQKYVVISGCGFPNSKNNFDALKKQFKLRFPNGVFMLTVPQSPMFNAKEADIVTKPYLELVKQAGVDYGKTFSVNNDLLLRLNKPMIPEEVYVSIVNGSK